MSQLEDDFLAQVRDAGLDEPVREFVFALPRRWRFDFYWPEQRVAVEVEGGVWTKGRHTRGSGFAGDVEKYNEAARQGITVLRVITTTVKDKTGIALVKEILDDRRVQGD